MRGNRPRGRKDLAVPFTTFWKNEILDHILNDEDYPAPTIYVALSTTDPASSFTEPSGGSYARKVTADTDWNDASAGTKDNGTAITFAQATGSWGTVAYFGLYDASTSGNLLAYGTLTTSKAVGNGDTVEFAAGNLDVSIT